MSRNFSAPRSAPKPASVTVVVAQAHGDLVAMMELQPWAMLANGPPWTNAGSALERLHEVRLESVLQSAAIAPSAFRSCAVTGLSS